MKPEEIIERLNQFQLKLFVRGANGVEPASPPVLSENLLLIRGLMIQLVDCVADADLNYRHAKAKKFDELLQVVQPNGKNMSKSAALDALDMEPALVDMKIETERLKNYLKYVDGLCTSIQSVLKFQTASDKNIY